jgi:hypothetical protein
MQQLAHEYLQLLTDCERTFSSGRKLINPERNRLSDDVVEAVECLKA